MLKYLYNKTKPGGNFLDERIKKNTYHKVKLSRDYIVVIYFDLNGRQWETSVFNIFSNVMKIWFKTIEKQWFRLNWQCASKICARFRFAHKLLGYFTKVYVCTLCKWDIFFYIDSETMKIMTGHWKKFCLLSFIFHRAPFFRASLLIAFIWKLQIQKRWNR